jgi:hypothetical protein
MGEDRASYPGYSCDTRQVIIPKPRQTLQAAGPTCEPPLAVSSTVAYDLSNPRVGNAYGGSSKTGPEGRARSVLHLRG